MVQRIQRGLRRAVRNLGVQAAGDEITVRAATMHDLGSMTGLLGELFRIESDFAPDVRRQRIGLATLLKSPTATLLVAVTQDGAIVGMCTLQPLISTAEGGTVGLVEDLVVSEAWRGRGIGSRLLAAIEATARSQHMTRLQLLSDMDNIPALHFYKQHDWRKTRLITLRKLFSQ